MNSSTLDFAMECPTLASSESDLIAGLRMGETAAYETLVRTHGGQMLAVARRMLRSEQDADDAWQEALLSVFRKADTFEESAKLSTWLHRITVNACLMKLRSQRRRHEVEIDELLPRFDETGHHNNRISSWETGPLAGVEREETSEWIRACIEQLPETHRTVLMLRDIEEMETEEVARLLGCSTNCVKTRLHRARQALRTLLEPMFTQQVA